jgi:hypothetical protein
MSPLSILIIIVVIILIILILRYIFVDKYTLQDIQNGKTLSVINASNLATNGSNIPSTNFSYSVWFYVNDWNYRYGEHKVIFGRMGASSGKNNGSMPGISGTDPCPVVALGAIENNLNIGISCFPGINKKVPSGSRSIVHTCSVGNVPIQKWVNLIISVYGRTLDVYIDGKLVRTCLLPGIANVNNNSNLFVTPNGGFEGWTSKLQYYPNSLNPQEAWNIYVKGYGGNWFSNIFQGYQLKFALIQDGVTQSSITI